MIDCSTFISYLPCNQQECTQCANVPPFIGCFLWKYKTGRLEIVNLPGSFKRSILNKKGDGVDKDTIKQLSAVRLFEGIDEQDIPHTLRCIEGGAHHYAKGEYIFMEGNDLKRIGLIISGTVQMIKEDVWGEKWWLTARPDSQDQPCRCRPHLPHSKWGWGSG